MFGQAAKSAKKKFKNINPNPKFSGADLSSSAIIHIICLYSRSSFFKMALKNKRKAAARARSGKSSLGSKKDKFVASHSDDGSDSDCGYIGGVSVQVWQFSSAKYKSHRRVPELAARALIDI